MTTMTQAREPETVEATVRLDVGRVTRLLRAPEVDAEWDGCLEGWSGEAEESDRLREWIADIREEFLSLLADVEDSEEVEVAALTWLIHLKSRWILMNLKMQYQMQRTGMPDMALMFRGSLLTSFLERLESMLTFRDVEDAHAFLANPLRHQREAGKAAVDEQRLDELRATTVELGSVRASLFGAIDGLNRQVEQLDGAERTRVAPAISKVRDRYQGLHKVYRELQERVSGLRMLPAGELLQRVERFATKAAERLDRRVAVEFEGDTVQLEREVADTLLDPLTTLVEFQLSQSLEPPSERNEQGKEAKGTLRVEFVALGNRIQVVLEDDGRVVPVSPPSAGEPPADHRAVEGPTVDEPSILGRLDPVLGRAGVNVDPLQAEKVTAAWQQLLRAEAELDVEARSGGGLRIRIGIPQKRVFSAFMIVRVGSQRFGVPAYAMSQVVSVSEDAIHRSVEGPMVTIRDRLMALRDAGGLLGLEESPSREAGDQRLVVIVEAGGRTVALGVDGVDGLGEGVVQPLDHDMVDTPLIAGASVSEDGQLLLVLDVERLLDS